MNESARRTHANREDPRDNIRVMALRTDQPQFRRPTALAVGTVGAFPPGRSVRPARPGGDAADRLDVTAERRTGGDGADEERAATHSRLGGTARFQRLPGRRFRRLSDARHPPPPVAT